jgi:hypothetical protein
MASDVNKMDTPKSFDYRRTNSKISSKEELTKRNTAASKNFEHRLRAIDGELKRFSQDFEREKTRLLGSLKQMQSDKRKDVVWLLKEGDKREEIRKIALKDKQDFEQKHGELAPEGYPAPPVQNVYLSLPKIIITRTSDEVKNPVHEETDQDTASHGKRPRRRRSSLFESLKASLRVPDDPNILDQLKVRNVPHTELLQSKSVKWDIQKLEVQKELQQVALEHYAARLSKRRSLLVTAPMYGVNGPNHLIVLYTNEKDSTDEAIVEQIRNTGLVREPVFSENSPRRRVTVTGTSPSKQFQQAVDEVYKENGSKRGRKISLDFEPRQCEKVGDEQGMMRGGTGGARRGGELDEDKPNSCPARLNAPQKSSDSGRQNINCKNTNSHLQEKQNKADVLTIHSNGGNSGHVRPCDSVLLKHEFSVTKLRSAYKEPQKPKLRTRSMDSINMHIRRHSKISTVTLLNGSIELDSIQKSGVIKPHEKLLPKRDDVTAGKLVYQHSDVPEFGHRRSSLRPQDTFASFPQIRTPDSDSQNGEGTPNGSHLSPILLNPLNISRPPRRRCSPKRVHFTVP